jgi:23S rRNA (cytidine2498-2'-O)-methyltransferase
MSAQGKTPNSRHKAPRATRPTGRSPPAKSAAIPPTPTRVEAPLPGQWLYTCRAGAHPTVLGPALVAADRLWPGAFARAAFRVEAVSADAAAVAPLLERAGRLHLQAWAPDSEPGNRLSGRAQALLEALKAPLAARGQWVADAWSAAREGLPLWQVVPLDEERFALGQVSPAEALSLSPGGRHRMRRGTAPSRAAMKLEEALDWLGLAPGAGDLCVDLGAAPGGWTQRLLERGARVWAVDPGALRPELMRQRKLRHFQASAFSFQPDEPADWLFCDMAWRPLEVAQLLAKWARKGWATMLVANLKLPMKDKLPVLARARATLAEGGWKDVRVRQLYHDRDEVTLTARR